MTESAAVRSPHKVFAFSLLAILVFAGLVWGGGILYWHLRIAASLRSWERDIGPGATRTATLGLRIGEEDSDFLYLAGCRVLPQMVSEMNATSNPKFQENLMGWILFVLKKQDPDQTAVPSARWWLHDSDTDADRRRKRDDFTRWWKEHGIECHQVWRFWSGNCPKASRS